MTKTNLKEWELQLLEACNACDNYTEMVEFIKENYNDEVLEQSADPESLLRNRMKSIRDRRRKHQGWINNINTYMSKSQKVRRMVL